MAYSEKDTHSLAQLLERVSDRVSYRDTPALREMQQVVENHLQAEIPPDADTMVDSIAILRYLADRYEYLGRFSVAAECYDRALHLAAQLHREHGIETDCAADMLRLALKARNFYVDDNCVELLALCRSFLPGTDKIAKDALSTRRHLKHDPVEMTAGYLTVIDAAEEYVEQNRAFHGHGSCHQAWRIKKEFLLTYDILWRSPAELNPRVHFD